jgi:hypothetical protein
LAGFMGDKGPSCRGKVNRPRSAIPGDCTGIIE